MALPYPSLFLGTLNETDVMGRESEVPVSSLRTAYSNSRTKRLIQAFEQTVHRSRSYSWLTSPPAAVDCDPPRIAAPIRRIPEDWLPLSVAINNSHFITFNNSYFPKVIRARRVATLHDLGCVVQRGLLLALAVAFLLPWRLTVDGVSIHPIDFALVPLLVVWGLDRARVDRFRIDGITAFLVALAAIGLLSAALAPRVGLAVNGAAIWARGALVFLIVRSTAGRIFQTRELLSVALFLLAVQGGLGVIQSLFQTDVGALNQYVGTKEPIRYFRAVGAGETLRAQGTLRNPNILASWLLLLLPLGVLGVRRAGSRRTAVVRAGATIIGGIALLSTISRGAIAIGVALVVLWAVLQFAGGRGAAYLGGVGLSVVAAALLLAPIRAAIFESIRGGENRLAMIIAGMRVIRKRPLSGTGYNNFVVVKRMVVGKQIVTFDGYRVGVHNIFVVVAAEAGLVAFVLFLGFLLFVARSLLAANQSAEWQRIDLQAYLIAFVGLLASMTIYTAFSSFQFQPLAMAALGVFVAECE